MFNIVALRDIFDMMALFKEKNARTMNSLFLHFEYAKKKCDRLFPKSKDILSLSFCGQHDDAFNLL